MVLAAILTTYLASALILPFPNWTSFRVALNAVVAAEKVTIWQRMSMLRYLFLEVVILPIWAVFWICDELLFSDYHEQRLHEPVFIVSQPRSGTTFLLRTLSEDRSSFLSIKHLEWRYPYISFWYLIDVLGLRRWLESRSYWPNNELGQKCRRIHPHVLGNYEEFGIFLEERFYHHYFLFRRFPFQSVLDRISRFDDLPIADKDRMVTTFLRVIKKVYYYRGQGETLLAKENESVQFCRAVLERLDDARLLMICREPQPMLNSYLTMSVTCTRVKHGVDPTVRDKWQLMNTSFRRSQCKQFVEFWGSLRGTRNAVLVSFHDFTRDVLGTTTQIYRKFEMSLSPEFRAYLEETQAKQEKRDKGYENLSCSVEGFEFYSEFVRRATKGKDRLEAAQ